MNLGMPNSISNEGGYDRLEIENIWQQAVTEPKSSKKDKIFALMQRPEGATIEEMVKISEWQSHTVRGFLSMQKKAGKNVTSERINDERRYRIGEAPAKAEETSA